jgi:iron complex outermembrane receptor protein
MSECMNANDKRTGFRWQLLATASTIALLGFSCESNQAWASDSAPFWIELGGQFAQEQTDQEIFTPPFLSASPFDAASHVALEKTPPSSWDGAAKLAYEPAGTSWVFSASILYGKSTRNGSVNQLTAQGAPGFGVYAAYQKFTAGSGQSHSVLDFQAGKDVGLGMFGSGGRSVASLGVRYAQFDSRSSAAIQSQPTNIVASGASYHKFYATFAAKRKFTGVGPSLSWDASADLIGNPSSSNITFDWGLNGAILFGRQRTQINHQTTGERVVNNTFAHPSINPYGTAFAHIPIYQHHASPSRSKQTSVPNLGGFAGISLRFPNAKVIIGYRADFFFGAMDGGIDAAHRENVGFYGPFASVSVGLGG